MHAFLQAPWTARLLNLGCLVGIVVFSLLATTELYSEGIHDNMVSGDVWLCPRYTKQVLKKGHYPVDRQDRPLYFVYPPTTLIFWHTLSYVGQENLNVLWNFLPPMVLMLSLYWLRQIHNPGQRSHTFVFMALALFAVMYAIEWDFHARNINTIFLLLITAFLGFYQQGQKAWAAVFLSLSVALKLYSGIFLIYLFFKRDFRACFYTSLGLFTLFVLAPVGFFGPDQALFLSLDWFARTRQLGQVEIALHFGAFVTSLERGLLGLLTLQVGLGKSNIANWTLQQAQDVAHIIQLIWLAAVGGYFVLAKGIIKPREDSRHTLLRDAGVLMMITLPFSPILQPHHATVLIIATAWLADRALDYRFSWTRRGLYLAILLGNILWTEIGPGGPLRGLGVFGTCCFLLAASYLDLFQFPHLTNALTNQVQMRWRSFPFVQKILSFNRT